MYSQDFQAIVKNEIARKDFRDFDSAVCTKTIPIQLGKTNVRVLNSLEHFVNKVDSADYKVEFIGHQSIWYRIEAEANRDLNFSIFPLQTQNINFVLYKVNATFNSNCPKADQLQISRAVLMESSDLLKGVGLTGESTADYTDTKNVNNILYATPYHKSVYLENRDVYLLNVIVRSDDISHTLSIANTTITVQGKKVVQTEFKKAQLKSFLYGGKNKVAPAQTDSSTTAVISTSEPVISSDVPEKKLPELMIANEYDHYLYEPGAGETIKLPSEKDYKPAKPSLSEADVFAMENPKMAKEAKEAITQSSYNANNINGKLLYADGTPASQVNVYITDVSVQTDHRMTGVKTNADGSFSLPITAKSVFISADADDAKKANKTPLKIAGTLPASKKDVKIYGAKIQPDAYFEIANVTLVAYGNDEFVPAASVASKSNTNSSASYVKPAAGSTEGLVYKIQVGAYKNAKSFKQSRYKRYGEIGSYPLEDNLIRYTVGNFTELDEAENTRQRMIADGIEGAFVVGFKNGVRTAFR